MQTTLPEQPSQHAGCNTSTHINNTNDTCCFKVLQHIRENDISLCQGEISTPFLLKPMKSICYVNLMAQLIFYSSKLSPHADL